jgi:hypothetical protein
MRNMDAVRAQLREIVENIDTGAGDLEIARALVVFNLSDRDITGAAVLGAEIGWPADEPMPGVDIVRFDGLKSHTEIRVKRQFSDPKGRPNRVRIAFDLIFMVDAIPSRSWRTYRATYCAPGDQSGVPLDITPELIVIETLFHAGSLPAVGVESDSTTKLP